MRTYHLDEFVNNSLHKNYLLTVSILQIMKTKTNEIESECILHTYTPLRRNVVLSCHQKTGPTTRVVENNWQLVTEICMID